LFDLRVYWFINGIWIHRKRLQKINNKWSVDAANMLQVGNVSNPQMISFTHILGKLPNVFRCLREQLDDVKARREAALPSPQMSVFPDFDRRVWSDNCTMYAMASEVYCIMVDCGMP